MSFFPGADRDQLAAMLLRLTNKVEHAPTGLILGEPTHKNTVRVTRLADSADLAGLDDRWDAAFGAQPRFGLHEDAPGDFYAAAERQLDEREFGWFAWRTMKLDVSDKDVVGVSLAVHREVLLPAFFRRYPGGRVLAVSYEHRTEIEGYLSVVNILTRARRFGFDPKTLLASSGNDSMAWIGLHHPVYFLWYSLLLAFAAFFPKLHGFVATLQHQGFLVYLLPQAEVAEGGEPSWFERTMPGLTMATSDGAVTESGDVRFRKSPIAVADAYSVDELEAYVSAVAHNLERTMQRFCDLTKYPDVDAVGVDARGDAVPVVDLGFARNTLLTLFVLLRRTIKNEFESDTFERVMKLFDLVDLHASLVSANPSESVEEFKRLIHRDYTLSTLASKLRLYPGRPGADLARGLRQLRNAATAVVERGILSKRSGTRVIAPDGSCNGVTTTAPLKVGDFEARLLRALRNTKHGYETRDADLLAMHTGAVDEDFPDYALALMLGLLADSEEYALRH